MNRHQSQASITLGRARRLARIRSRWVAALASALLILAGVSAAGALAAGGQRANANGPTATVARQLNVSEKAHLHLVSHHHEVIIEEGTGTGTLSGKVVLHLTLAYAQASVTFTAYPPGGTISGRGEGSAYANGNIAHFTGTASITSGTGKYAHASASNVKIKGTLQKKTFAFALELTATLRY